MYNKLKKVLSKETLALVDEEVGDDFDWGMVPYARFKTVNDAKRTAEAKVIELESKLDDGDSFQFTQGDLDKALKDKETELMTSFNTQLNAMKVREAALEHLRKVGALDPELIYESSKFEKDKLALNKDGKLEGIDDVVNSWKTDRPALFKEDVPGGTGKEGGTEGTGADKIDALLSSVFGTRQNNE